MAKTEEQGLDTDQVTVTDDQPKETITAEERAELETLRKQSELSKNEISTRDKKLTELQKEVKARMTAEEQAKMQADEERKEWLSDIARTKAEALQLDEKHSELIKGNSKDEINQSAELIKSFKESLVKDYEKQLKAKDEEIAILKANGSVPPAGGQSGALKLEYTREELKDPEVRKAYQSTKGSYIKNE